MNPYFQTDNATIYHGDNIATMQAVIPDASIDLVVTSPPYDNLRTYGGHSWDFEGLAAELWRAIKPGGVVVWVVNDATVDGSETGTSFRQALHFKEIGFRLHDTMIWQRIGSFPESNRYHPAFEYMFVFSKGQPSTSNIIKDRENTYAGQKCRSRMERQPDGSIRRPQRTWISGAISSRFNIWEVPASACESNPEKSLTLKHPATFPESLARDHILSWSNEGDTVLDPFSGSGTTVKMARLMGRRGVGIEVNKEYCDITVERLRQRVLF